MYERGTEGHKMCCQCVRLSSSPIGEHSSSNCRLKDINEHCLDEFRRHWNCLDNNNHQMWQCRRSERVLNRCVFEKIVGILSHSKASSLTRYRVCKKSYQIHQKVTFQCIYATDSFSPTEEQFYSLGRVMLEL